MMTPELLALAQAHLPVPAITFRIPTHLTADQLLAICRQHTSARRFTRDAQGTCVGIWIEQSVTLPPAGSVRHEAYEPGHWQVFAAIGSDDRWHQTKLFASGSPVVSDWIPEELC